MEKYVMHNANKPLLTMIDNKLQEVKIECVHYNELGNIFNYVVKNGDNEILLSPKTKFYANEEAFKLGNHEEANRLPSQGYKLLSDKNGCLYYPAWKMENGEPISKNFDIVGFVVSRNELNNGIKSITLCDGEDINNVYESREDCLAYNEYKIVEDGEEKTRVGIAKLISLTDEQKELISKFIEMTKTLEDNNIRYVFDRDNEKIGFYNTENVSKAYLSWDDDCSDDFKAYPTKYIDWSLSQDFYIDTINCEYSLFVKK